MKDETPSSASRSLPSLLLLTQERDQGTPSSAADTATTIDAPAIAQNENDQLDYHHHDILSTTSRQSSSSSLWEIESTAANADTAVMSDDENKKLTFDGPDLKNILSEVELLTGNSASEWLGLEEEEVMEGEGSGEDNEGINVQQSVEDNNYCPTAQKSTNYGSNNYHDSLSPIDPANLLDSPVASPRYNNMMIQGKFFGLDDGMRLCCSTPPPMKCPPQASHDPTVNTPTPPLSTERNINKSSSYNNTQREWIDPFPTPDVSIHSMYGSPCSSTITRGCSDHDELGDSEGKRMNNILNAIPTFPPIEEFADHYTLSPLRPSSNTDGGTRLSVRKVHSESNLRLIERLSMESIWGALNSGPDGNELLSESNNNNNNDLVNIRNTKMHRRRHSEMGTNLQSKSLECLHDSATQAMTPPRLTDKRYSIHRSLTVPMELTGDGHHRKRSMQKPESTCCHNNVDGMNQTNNHVRTRRRSLIASDPHNDWVPGNPINHTNRRFRALRIKSSKAVASAKNSAGEVFSPVRTVVQQSTQRAAKLVRHTRQRLKERKELRKQRRLASSSSSSSPTPRSWWIVIPADHPYKIIWDILTMLWAALGAYRTHVRIRDRVFDQSPLIILTEVWFTVDILLNFITEHKTSEGDVIRDGKAVWARYLTTWFVVDILSLIPWERIYVRPIVERIKRRNFFQKTFFRSKAVVRVSRVLRGRHIKLFGRVSKRTGMSLHRMVALLIKYLPKYLLFLRNMKGALVIRALRFIHWLHEIYKKIWVKARNARQNLAVRRPLFSPNETEFESESDDDDDDDTDEDDDDDDDDDDESDNDDQPRRRLFTES